MEHAEETIRKVFRVGGSLVIAIPPSYINSKDIKEGDQMRILMDDFLHTRPMKDEKKKLESRLEKAKKELDR